MPFELTPEFNDKDKVSRSDKIVLLLKGRGFNTLEEFAEYARTTEIYTPEERAYFDLRGYVADVRRALKTLDKYGMPKAGPTAKKGPSGAPLWGVRAWFDFEDYCYTVAGYNRILKASEAMKQKFVDECVERFHKPPVESYEGSIDEGEGELQ